MRTYPPCWVFKAQYVTQNVILNISQGVVQNLPDCKMQMLAALNDNCYVEIDLGFVCTLRPETLGFVGENQNFTKFLPGFIFPASKGR